MMSQFELVWIPIILAALFLILGTRIILWRNKKLRLMSSSPNGSGSVLILGLSFLLLSGFSLFLALFFLITG